MNLPSQNQIPEASTAAFEDCTVTAVSPLRIKRDADTSELAFTPDTLVNTAFLTIGDRVRVDISRNPMLIIGRADGLAGVDTIVARDAAILVATRGQIPSSVAIGSGSASVAADGTVTFTAASSVSLNGVFNGLGMDAYEVTFDLVTASVSGINVRLRLAGTDAATAYDSGRFTVVNTTSAGVQSLGGTSWVGAGGLGGAGWREAGKIEVFGPALVAATQAIIENSLTPNPMTTGAGWYKGVLLHQTAAAYDGISFLCGTGVFTGKAKVRKL